ncbi:phosphoribosylanthranilate isomerase [Novosphingobium sp.]|uniref:phosphoribosylanthranilate isomerase n=1 Tax=Novosphingobium sp. TaxID=1874826 RepID=UPI0035AF06CE
MPAPAIKICGVTTAETLEVLIAERVDHVGFNFIAKSPRYLNPEQAARLGAHAAGRINRVGLFLDAEDASIGEAIAAAGLDAVQLHGEETPERAAQVRDRFGLPVWKALPVASNEDVASAAAYVGAVDLVLFDAKTPKGTLPGGMGVTFDWSLLTAWKAPCAWGLAGGLNPANVAEAARITGAPLVDAASGVETALGVKDAAKIAAFCAAVRSL